MSKLPDPFGSPPHRPAEYVLYVSRRGDDDTQAMVVAFGAPYSARKFLDALLESDGYVWEDECTIRSESGVVVTTRWWPGRLRECVEHEYSLPEMAWTLDPQHRRWARNFRYGPPQPRTVEDDGAVREKRERRAATPREDAPPGFVHVSDVALSMGVDARDARRALRAVMEKPKCGWWFDPKDLDDVKAKIRAELE